MPELLSLDSDLLIDLEDDEDLDGEITQDRLLYNPDKINIATREPTLEQLLRRVGEDALDLAPDFQRHANLWKDKNKSQNNANGRSRICLGFSGF